MLSEIEVSSYSSSSRFIPPSKLTVYELTVYT